MHARSRPARPPGRAGRAWQGWRGWRLSRPFWGALLVVAAGAQILAVSVSPWLLHPHAPAGVLSAGILVASALVLTGLLLWFHPVQRSVYSTAAILLAIFALMTAHLGGYLLGSLLGAVGGALAFAWVPADQQEPRSRYDRAARADGPGLKLIVSDSLDNRPPDEKSSAAPAG